MIRSQTSEFRHALSNFWQATRLGIRRYPHRRRVVVQSVLLTAILLGYLYVPTTAELDGGDSLVPTTLKGLLDDVLSALVLCAAAVLALNAIVSLAMRTLKRRLWPDLRANPRYARLGLLSALMTTCVMVYYYTPINLNFDSWLWLYTRPAFRALQDFVFVAGFGIAILTGLVAVARPALLGRVLGVVGAVVSANYLSEYLTSMSLWEHVQFESEYGIGSGVACLASLAHDLAGGQKEIALLLFLAPAVSLWAALRKPAMRFVDARIAMLRSARS
jgi:hypothetical protein